LELFRVQGIFRADLRQQGARPRENAEDIKKGSEAGRIEVR
jgi:hypothetical protein